MMLSQYLHALRFCHLNLSFSICLIHHLQSVTTYTRSSLKNVLQLIQQTKTHNNVPKKNLNM